MKFTYVKRTVRVLCWCLIRVPAGYLDVLKLLSPVPSRASLCQTASFQNLFYSSDLIRRYLTCASGKA
jgi:hypothetical protein